MMNLPLKNNDISKIKLNKTKHIWPSFKKENLEKNLKQHGLIIIEHWLSESRSRKSFSESISFGFDAYEEVVEYIENRTNHSDVIVISCYDRSRMEYILLASGQCKS
jgi:O-succinylbenzoate synthase